MEKRIIEVPKEVRFISEWPNFNTDLLKGHSIINKTITGCGFTHFCLTNNIPTILCSPRKFLLENKFKQIDGLYLVVNNGEKGLDIDGENLKENKKIVDMESPYESIIDIQNNLRIYILNCQTNCQIPKILVTYDSLKYVLEVIGDLIRYYSIIVDEFQNIFMDSRFKADTELNFLSYLQDCPNVTYLSATPYIEEYLNELDEFKDLPYYELKWHSDRLQTIKIEPRKSHHISRDIDLIIQDYLNSRFPEKVDENGIVHQSKEIVFYTNSVKMICNIIRRNSLTSDQVNVICADTNKNKLSLSKIGINLGTAPLEGEPHKMFTFCTRTTYAGADFYSPCAMSVIVSDCKIDALSTDIRMDFPQIMGRQRLKENVFRDECIFIFSLSDSSITMEEFKSLSQKKLKVSDRDLNNFRSIMEDHRNIDGVVNILDDIRRRIRCERYSGDYTGVDEKTGKPIVNKLVFISERRAFEIRSNVYKSEVQVYNEFAKVTADLSYEEYIDKTKELEGLRSLCTSKGSFEAKMKVICDLLLNPRWNTKIHISDLYWLPRTYRNYLNYLGPEKIRSSDYYEASLKKEMDLMKSFRSEKDTKKDIQDPRIQMEFIKEFIISERYTLKCIKKIIKEVYVRLNITKTPKATDLLEYFEVKPVFIYDSFTKKQSKGYEILSLK